MTATISDHASHELLACALRLHTGKRHREALAFLRVLDATSPIDKAPVYKLMGACHQHDGDTDEAARCYRASLALAPDDPETLTNLGEILLARLSYTEALESLQRAVALDPRCSNPASLRARALIVNTASSL